MIALTLPPLELVPLVDMPLWGAMVAFSLALFTHDGVLAFIAIALFNQCVETVLRDPASLNKPSTVPLPEALMLPPMPGLDVHWGLAAGLILALSHWRAEMTRWLLMIGAFFALSMILSQFRQRY